VALLVEAEYRGEVLGRLELGSTAMSLLPGQEQPVNHLLALAGDASNRRTSDDPVLVNARVDYVMDTSPAPSVRYVTTATIEMTKAGQFLTHQVLASEPIVAASATKA
jgi:hypothetical protein